MVNGTISSVPVGNSSCKCYLLTGPYSVSRPLSPVSESQIERFRSKPLGPPLPEADQREAGSVLLGLRDVLAEVLADEVHEEPGRIVSDLPRPDGGGDEVQRVGFAGLHPARVRGLDEERFEPVDAPQVQRRDVAQRRDFPLLPF